MLLCCTKKLLDELNVKPSDGGEINDLFCWSANILTINRRKALVVVNDGSRFGFVLYGLKAKDLGRLQELIADGIRKCLQDEKIKDEVIGQYLKDAGELAFSKTRGRTYVSRLNKACERVQIFEERLDLSDLYQTDTTRSMNDDYIKPNKEAGYIRPHDLLIQDFKRIYGDEVIQTKAVDLVIKLDLGSGSATRRVIVPIDITFKELHAIIQTAFDWQSSHLYDFNIYDRNGQCMLNVISEFEEIEGVPFCPVAVDRDTGISDYVQKGYKIVYCYDYGDNWTHVITVHDLLDDYHQNYPECIMGQGNRPPEDVGGIPGYEEFRRIMSDPNHAEYKSTKRWVESQWYQDFNIGRTNKRLKYLLR